jgi:hypothetical protein
MSEDLAAHLDRMIENKRQSMDDRRQKIAMLRERADALQDGWLSDSDDLMDLREQRAALDRHVESKGVVSGG